MVDFITIGFAAETSGLAKAETALDDLAKSADRANAAASKVGAGMSESAAAAARKVDDLEKEIAGARVQAEALAKTKIDPVGTAAAASVGKFAGATTQAGQAAKLTAGQMQQLGFQVNDLVTQIASGASPMQAFVQQGGQIYQALGMGPGGVGGAIRGLVDGLGRLALSGGGVFAGLVLGAGAYAVAVSNAQEKQKQLEQQLSFGLGRFSGVTAEGLRQITDQAAQAANLSKSSALELGLEFARTGKIGAEMYAGLIVAAQRYANATGKSIDDAKTDLAKAFADPAKGVEQLAQSLGASTDFLSHKTRTLIKEMAASGETTKAQGLLLEQLASGPMPKIEQRVDSLASLWRKVKQSASDAGDAMVRALTTTPGERSNDLMQSLQGLNISPVYDRRRAAMQKELREIMDQVDEAEDMALSRQRSRDAEAAAMIEKAARERAAAHALEIQAIAATTDVERAAIAGKQAYARAIEQGLGEQRAKIEQNYAEARSLESLKASLDQTIRGYQDQAAASNVGAGVLNMGGGMGAANAAMEKYQQLAQLQREIDAADGQTKADLIEKYKALATAIDENTAARTRMQAAQSIDALNNEAEILRKKISLYGEENSYIEKKIALLQVEQQIRASGIDPFGAEAMEWRQRAEEVQNLRQRLDELNRTSDGGADSAKRLGEAWKSAAASIQQTAMAAVGAGSALQTAFAAAFSGAGGAQTSGQLAVYSNGYAQARSGYSAFQQQAQNDNRAAQSELQRTISMLERSIQNIQGRWENYQPDPYAEKNPLVFYDVNRGTRYTEAERAQITALESQLATQQKQLAELQRIAQVLSMPASQAFRDPMTFRTDRNMGPSVFDNFVNVGGVLVQRDLASLYSKQLYGFAEGGSMMLGGKPGRDNNVLSLNGSAIARVSKGERLDVLTPRQQMQGAGGAAAMRPAINDNRTFNINIRREGLPPSTQRQWEDERMADERLARRINNTFRGLAR